MGMQYLWSNNQASFQSINSIRYAAVNLPLEKKNSREFDKYAYYIFLFVFLNILIPSKAKGAVTYVLQVELDQKELLWALHYFL